MKEFGDKKDIRIVYMGSPAMSEGLLRRLLEAGYEVVAVISQPDKPLGRKRVLTPCPVKEFAISQNIPVYTPVKIKTDYEFLKDIDHDIILTFSYGQIVPQEVLDLPKHGAFNLHGSLLPEYRGAAPIQRALMNGDDVTGISLMEMVLKMDAGRVFAKKEIRIEEEDNYTSLCEKMEEAAFACFDENILSCVNGENPGVPQEEEKASYAAKILPEEERLSLSLDRDSFINAIRGLSLTPGAYLYLEGKKLKILKASKIEGNSDAAIGEIVSDSGRLVVALKDGLVRLEIVQLEGKKPMDDKSFLNGMRGLKGKRLS